MPVTLTPRERSHLKARAHSLEPVVRVGHGGATDKVVAEVERALAAHQLIKIKLDEADRDIREQLGETVSARTDAAVVQRVGKVIVLWRPKAEVEAEDD